MTIAEIPGNAPRSDAITDHERLRNLGKGDPHPQYSAALAAELAAHNLAHAALPLGVLGSVVDDTNTMTGITTEVAIISMTLTVTVPAGRLIRVSFQALCSKTVADGAQLIRIKEDGTLKQTTYGQAQNNTDSITLMGDVLLTPSAGEHTYALYALRAGTGTMVVNGHADYPRFLLVEDIGAA